MKTNSKQWLSLLAVSALSSGITLGAFTLTSNQDHPTSKDEYKAPATFASMHSSTAIGPDFTVAAENSVHAVVHIKATMEQKRTRQANDPFFDFFFGDRGFQRQEKPEKQVGFGSGVIISTDGYIVTNNHVIDNSDELDVTLNDNRSFKAKLIGTDPATDIALLKIEEKNLPTIPFGDSEKLKIGEWVLAVGNPFNLTSTVTAGIVSAKARSIGIASQQPGSMKIESFIQTDAAVNPGNSGGALVNTKGELVGINTAIASQTGNYAGYSFAVPVSIVSKIVGDLKQFGTVQRALLGVEMTTLTSELAKEKGIDIFEGAYIKNVVERSAAMEAGLKPGDVVVAVNENKVKSSSELQEQISRYRPGDKIKITVKRGKEVKTFSVTLKNKEGNTSVIKESGVEVLGAAFKSVSNELKMQLGINSGVQVTGLTKGKFEEAGIRKGFIIIKINEQRVSTPDDVTQIASKIVGGSFDNRAMFIVGLYPNGKTAYYAIDLSQQETK